MNKRPIIAVLSFPGNNCEVESLRAIKDSGMEARFFRWNDDRSKLKDVDGYFVPGGFSYEDRGRSGMVAARDSLMQFLHEESTAGKAIIGNCNGAQILVESGLIPLDAGLRMCLARNVIETERGSEAVGFLNEWVWIKRTCKPGRCATAFFEGIMHLPMAHGEGRFTTKDKDMIDELKKNDQIAFSYCDAEGNVSTDPIVTPNGSLFAIAGICNPAGNVVALMPHPERTPGGKPYFDSLKQWFSTPRRGAVILGHDSRASMPAPQGKYSLGNRKSKSTEIFIDTIIVNNEERTVEQAAKRIAPRLKLKQWKYISLQSDALDYIFSNIAVFNPNKERAFIKKDGKVLRWNAQQKKAEVSDADAFEGISLLRRDVPDTGAGSFGHGSETGVCYTMHNVSESDLAKAELLEIFANPHASTLERMH